MALGCRKNVPACTSCTFGGPTCSNAPATAALSFTGNRRFHACTHFLPKVPRPSGVRPPVGAHPSFHKPKDQNFQDRNPPFFANENFACCHVRLMVMSGAVGAGRRLGAKQHARHVSQHSRLVDHERMGKMPAKAASKGHYMSTLYLFEKVHLQPDGLQHLLPLLFITVHLKRCKRV